MSWYIVVCWKKKKKAIFVTSGSRSQQRAELAAKFPTFLTKAVGFLCWADEKVKETLISFIILLRRQFRKRKKKKKKTIFSSSYVPSPLEIWEHTFFMMVEAPEKSEESVSNVSFFSLSLLQHLNFSIHLRLTYTAWIFEFGLPKSKRKFLVLIRTVHLFELFLLFNSRCFGFSFSLAIHLGKKKKKI